MQAEHQAFPAANAPGGAAGPPDEPGAGRDLLRRTQRTRRTRRTRRRKRILVGVAGGMALLLLALGGIAWWAYDRLNGNIKTEDFAGKLGETGRPPATNALNILLVGTDSRSGDNAEYGADPGNTQRSDTTILLHIPEGRKSALGVSFPRDLMVDVPSCQRADGTMSRAYFGMFNSALEVGGTACTIKTVEKLTDVRIDHQVTVDFTGFKKLVDALGGVPMHIGKPIDDKAAKLHLPAGDVTLDGEEALGFVRARKSIGDGSDIQRIERQQQFLLALVDKVKKESLLTSPTRLYGILDAATKAITTDPGLGSLTDLYDLLTSLKSVPQNAVKFETVPITTYAPDPNRVALVRPEADVLFARLRDESAAALPPTSGTDSPGSPSGTPSAGTGNDSAGRTR